MYICESHSFYQSNAYAKTWREFTDPLQLYERLMQSVLWYLLSANGWYYVLVNTHFLKWQSLAWRKKPIENTLGDIYHKFYCSKGLWRSHFDCLSQIPWQHHFDLVVPPLQHAVVRSWLKVEGNLVMDFSCDPCSIPVHNTGISEKIFPSHKKKTTMLEGGG